MLRSITNYHNTSRKVIYDLLFEQDRSNHWHKKLLIFVEATKCHKAWYALIIIICKDV